MNLNYIFGKILNKIGIKAAADFRWPTVNGELVVLALALLRAKKKEIIQIVQIGAFDGLACDPIVSFLKFKDIHALLVEPQTGPFASLVARYGNQPNIILVNAAISDLDGEVKMFVPAAGSSPKASLLKNHYKKFGKKSHELRSISARGLSVPSLLAKTGIKTVDLLQVDTEGMDFQILRWFFRSGIEPTIINFETIHLERNERGVARQTLLEHGYWWIDTDQDTFAIKESFVRSFQKMPY